MLLIVVFFLKLAIETNAVKSAVSYRKNSNYSIIPLSDDASMTRMIFEVKRSIPMHVSTINNLLRIIHIYFYNY